jgi:hypothetical protein
VALKSRSAVNIGTSTGSKNFTNMKKIISILILGSFFSCQKEEAIKPGIIVKESGVNYYAEIVNKELFEVGDSIRIQYNEMPRHPHSYPSKRRNEYTKVLIIRK